MMIFDGACNPSGYVYSRWMMGVVSGCGLKVDGTVGDIC